jgi:hypothetical protein
MKPLPAIRMVVGEDLPSPGPLPQPQRARTTTDGLSATTGGGP